MIRPAAEANKVTKLLDAVYPTEERFPVDIANVALEYSKHTSPDDPIAKIQAVDLDGFEGGLEVSPKKDKWAILYNANAIEGRQRFTMAHEFGHYLLHRKKYPKGIKCTEEEYRNWGSEENQIEVEANDFAATLLMPLNDFRNQIDANTPATYELLSQCSERYGTSYTATASRWISYTSTRSILVASREGYILWARSSTKAWKTRAFFKTSKRSPIEIPLTTQVATQGFNGVKVIEHPKGSWLQHEHCSEIALSSRDYDMTISILQLHPHNVNYIERY